MASACVPGSRSQGLPGAGPGRAGATSISNRLGVSARYSIVSGDPQAHREELLAIATRNRPGPRERLELKYNKYYEHSPLGPPSIFLARDNKSGEFVGMTALFPTTLRIAGELVPGRCVAEAPDRGDKSITIDAAYVRSRLEAVVGDEDLSRYIL